MSVATANEIREYLIQKFPRLDLVEAVKAEKAERSFYEFVVQAWVYVVVATFVPGKHIEFICAHLQAVTEGVLRWILFNVPPRHGKSNLVNVFWPAWEWGPRNRPGESYLSISNQQQLAGRDLVNFRKLVNSAWYQARWGHRFKWRDDRNRVNQMENDHGGYRLATSKGGALGQGGSRILFDDVAKVERIQSPEERAKDWEWYRETFMLRDSDPTGSVRIGIGQRTGADDIWGRMLQREKQWLSVILPWSYEPWRHCVTPIGQDWRTVEGQPLWPERFGGDEELAREHARLMEQEDPYIWGAQAQQNPSPPGGKIFHEEKFKRYRSLPLDCGKPFVFSTWDLATEGLQTGSACSGLLLAYYPQVFRYYVLAERYFRKEFPQQIEAMQELADIVPEAEAHVVEKQSNGAAACASLQGKVKGIQTFNIAGLGSKEQKWRAVAPRVHAGEVFVPEEDQAPWIKAWLHEVCGAPFLAANDRTDSFGNGILWNELQNPAVSRRKNKILAGYPALESFQVPDLGRSELLSPGAYGLGSGRALDFTHGRF